MKSWAQASLLRLVQHRRFPIWVLAAAIGVRLAWVVLIPVEPTTDFAWYFELGQRLADGLGYTAVDDGFPLWEPGRPFAEPRPTAFWPIGYPGFLAALFTLTRGLDPLWTAKVANIVLYVGLMVAAAYVARSVFRSALAGRLTLLLLALSPNQIAYTSLLSVEIWFSFLALTGIALTLLAAERRHNALLLVAGLCFGLATLTKPQAVLLPLLACLVIYRGSTRSAWRAVGTVYLTAALCVVPWSARNSLAFGKPVFVSNNGGINLLIGNMPGSWGKEGLMWNRELHEIVTSHSGELERDALALRTVLEHMRRRPLDVLLGLPKKFVLLYAVDVDGFGWNRASTPGYAESPIWMPLRLLSQAHYLVVLAAACIAALRFRRMRLTYFWLGPAFVAYFTLIYLVFFGGPRFHFPLVPWLAIYASAQFAAWFVPSLANRTSDGRGRAAAAQVTADAMLTRS